MTDSGTATEMAYRDTVHVHLQCWEREFGPAQAKEARRVAGLLRVVQFGTWG